MNSQEVIISGKGIHKNYSKNLPKPLPVLSGVDIEACKGQIISIQGRSGSGKSTLLNILSGLDSLDKGSVHYRDTKISKLSEAGLDLIRRKDFGYVFQLYHLIPDLTVLENVLLPSRLINRRPNRTCFEKAKSLLARMGMEGRLKHRPSQLSGGEMQRTAIARALINEPAVLFCDEPTGNLDKDSANELVGFLKKLSTNDNKTIIIVTHDLTVADVANSKYCLEDGVCTRLI